MSHDAVTGVTWLMWHDAVTCVTWLIRMWAQECVREWTGTCARMRVCACVRVCVCAYKYARERSSVRVTVDQCVCVCVCVCVLCVHAHGLEAQARWNVRVDMCKYVYVFQTIFLDTLCDPVSFPQTEIDDRHQHLYKPEHIIPGLIALCPSTNGSIPDF